ncbi:MAG: diguanylate cyclase [bacterium]|nr:diguanylate cyclase [bacterium]
MVFSKFFNKIKSYGEKISEFENVVSEERLSYSQVLERNAALQREIDERMDELQQANKSILTLQNIWSTMNSSEPLNEVLKTISHGMTANLGYLNAVIFQLFGDGKDAYLKIRESSYAESLKDLKHILNKNMSDFSVSVKCKDNIIIKTMSQQEIVNSEKFEDIFVGTNFSLEAQQISKISEMLKDKAIVFIPIIFQKKTFGVLQVISPRSELGDTELNFLNLFAKQIELAVTIADLFQTIKQQAITDGLTGLYNRRHFDQCLANEAKRSLRLKQPFTLITLDLDHLKVINDNYGHSAGDAAIIGIANALKKNARQIDIPSRFGGEEFGVILPGVDIDGGKIAAERLRATIENTPIEGIGQITASIGVGTLLTHSDNVQELVELVDQAMYRAKRNGRNQIQVAQAWDENIWKRQALDLLIHLLEQKLIHIDEKHADELIEKLKNTNTTDKNIDDIIFLVVDEFVNIYEPYQKGNVKEKMDMIVKVAKAIEISQEDIDKFKMAAIVYDISNIMLPENILLKDGPLTDAEKAEILNHPIIAAKEILAPIGTASNIIALLENWNEYYDGSGIPGILKGEEIPIGTAILVAINAYFALISQRPYRKAFSKAIALQILGEGAGKKWNPRIVEIIRNIV